MEDKRLDRIELKLDDISEHMSAIDITLGKQHVTLEDHIARTAILEKEFKPVRTQVLRAEGALKLITLAAAAVAIVEFLLHR